MLCSDGRTIKQNAFKHNDGQTVPLVWQHNHSDPDNILGHAILENREDGVYAYCTFNSNVKAVTSKELVKHGDIKQLSIYANQLVEQAKSVFHGSIREVSLVVTGANPGAWIDNLSFSHGALGVDVVDDTEGIISTGERVTVNPELLEHTDSSNEADLNGENSMSKPDETLAHEEAQVEDLTLQEVFDTMSEEQQDAANLMISHAAGELDEDVDLGESVITHADGGKKTIKEIFDTLTEVQKNVVYAMIGYVLDEQKEAAKEEPKPKAPVAAVKTEDAMKQSDEIADEDIAHSAEGGTVMKQNIFDAANKTAEETVVAKATLTHADFSKILTSAQQGGSLKEAFMAHAVTYGINDIDVMFPDAKVVGANPQLLGRRMDWVESVIGKTHHTPFARIKSVVADITADEARAKGYVTGNQKIEEVFGLLKRITVPTTVYKKQKLDRDDMVDITDVDIVAWLKGEMRIMLDEEVARCVLVGDGRSALSDDKVNSDCIRPIWTDDDLYTIKVQLVDTATASDVIDTVIGQRKNYRGSGNPVMYASPDFVAELLTLKELNTGKRLYKTLKDAAAELRVRDIIEVDVMDGLFRDVEGTDHDLLGVIVNLADYNIGADKGGAVGMFDDFDIDYNQYKYLIETRMSGALTRPKSAMAIERAQAAG